MIAGACGGHIEQPAQLAGLHLLLGLGQRREAGRLQTHESAAAGARAAAGRTYGERALQAPRMPVDQRGALAAQRGAGAPGDDHDRELQAFGLVDGSDAHHIATLVDERFPLVASLGGSLRPAHEVAQTRRPADGKRARQMKKLVEVGERLLGARAPSGVEFASPGATQELEHDLLHRALRARLVQLAEQLESRDHLGEAGGLRRQVVKAAAGALKEEEVLVGEPEQRRV